MSLTSAKQVETNKYELEIAVDGDTFNAAVDQAFRKNGKKMQVRTLLASRRLQNWWTITMCSMVRRSLSPMRAMRAFISSLP